MTQGVNRGMRMPTTADLMSMWNASGLKEKLIFTFLMLVLFRLGIHMPLYGINTDVLRIAGSNDILGFLDLFSGGALGKVSIFALGIGPYITSSIIMQLMAVIVPALFHLTLNFFIVACHICIEKQHKKNQHKSCHKVSHCNPEYIIFTAVIFVGSYSHQLSPDPLEKFIHNNSAGALIKRFIQLIQTV